MRGGFAVPVCCALAGCTLLVDTSGLSSPEEAGPGGVDAGIADGGVAEAGSGDERTLRDGTVSDAGIDAALDGALNRDAAATYRDAVLADGPTGYFRLGEASGTTAVDTAPGGVAGVFGGLVTLGVPGAIAGDPDTAVRFLGAPPGSVSRVTLDDRFAFAGTTAFTIETWIAPAGSADGNYHHVFTREQRSNPKQGYALLYGALGTVLLERYVGDVGKFSVDGPPLATGFTHVVCVYDGAALRLYLDGNQVGGDIADTRAMPQFSINAFIGAAAPAENPFPGVIDEVAVYAKPLTSARIRAHHDLGTH